VTGACAEIRPSETPFARRFLRRNFLLLLLDCGAWMFGIAFFDSTTVLPDVLHKLNASSTVIGFSRMVQTLAFTLPALLAAHYIHGRAQHKSFLLRTCLCSRLGLLTLPVVLYLYSASRPQFVVVWFFVVIGLFWLADGFTAVSWLDILAKTIPERVRGRFFGSMQMASGVLSVLASSLVAAILHWRDVPFPVIAAVLAGGWCLGAALSTVALSLLREPPGVSPDEGPKPGFFDFLRRALPLMQENLRFRRLIITRMLLDGAGFALPFYILYAHQKLGYPLVSAGLFVMTKMVGKAVTGPLWGWIVDRYGPMVGVRAVSAAFVAVPAAALAAGLGLPWLMLPAFFLMGAVEDACWMTATSAMLETIDERERPLAVGVATVFQAPAAIYSPIGGMLLIHAPYAVVFALALAFTAGGLIAALRTPGARTAPAVASAEA
jgi:MFS family permease